MNKAFEPEVIKAMFASTSPEQRVGIERRARELVKDKDFQAADILKHKSSIEFDDAKFVGQLGWLAALSVAICAVAVL